MSATKENTGMLRSVCRIVTFVLVILIVTNTALAKSPKESAATEKSAVDRPKRAGPLDDFDRGVPRSSVMGFFKASREGDYERAAKYLDLRNLPKGLDPSQGADLARRLKIVLDRSLWIDLDLLSTNPEGQSDDGLPSYRDMVGRIKTPKKTVDIFLQRVPRQDGVYIWKFSNRTVAEIPHLYKHFGYGPLEETLSKLFPDVQFLGWQLWQWALFLIIAALTYLIALVSTWVCGSFPPSPRDRAEPSDCLVHHRPRPYSPVVSFGQARGLYCRAFNDSPRFNPGRDLDDHRLYLGLDATHRHCFRFVGGSVG